MPVKRPDAPEGAADVGFIPLRPERAVRKGPGSVEVD